jgi:hypothetical protein
LTRPLLLFPNVIEGSMVLFSCLIEGRVSHHSRGPRSSGGISRVSQSRVPVSLITIPCTAQSMGFTFLHSAPLAEIRCVLYICKVASCKACSVESAQVETLNPQSLEHMGREEGKFLMQEHGVRYVAADGMWAPGCRRWERVFTYTLVPCAHQQYHNPNP